MHRTVIISIMFFVFLMSLIIYVKPDQLYDHYSNEWIDDDIINITNIGFVLSICIFLYVKKTDLVE